MNSFKSLLLAAVTISTMSLAVPVEAFAHGHGMGGMARSFQNSEGYSANTAFTTEDAVTSPTLAPLSGIPGAFTSLGGAPMMQPHPGMRP
jgi:hypothetical protein